MYNRLVYKRKEFNQEQAEINGISSNNLEVNLLK